MRTLAPICLVLPAVLAVSGCTGMVPATIGQIATPAPPEGAEYHHYSILRAEPLSTMTSGPCKGFWKDVRSAGYVVDKPGFPLPLFADPEKRDAATAHLTVCVSSSIDPESMSGQWNQGNRDLRHSGSLTATYYYDPTPEGDVADLDTFCGTSEDTVELGSDPTAEPWVFREAPASEISTTEETLVNRAAVLVGENGEAILATSPEGTRRHVKNSDHGNGFIEVWVYEYLE